MEGGQREGTVCPKAGRPERTRHSGEQGESSGQLQSCVGVWKLRRQEVRLERTRSPALPGLLGVVESRLGAGSMTV